MGPIALFDKSFLQSLTVDESVWFDHFFLPVVSPFFYVETLADLGKSLGGGRTPEDEVRIIAEKFPDMNGMPCDFHVKLALANLEGYPVSMTGKIPVSGGRPVKGGGRTGVVYDQSPEAKAFSRWQEGNFQDLERDLASAWRGALSSLPLEEIAKRFLSIGIGGESSRTFADAKAAAATALTDPSKSSQLAELTLTFLGAPPVQLSAVLRRWEAEGSKALGTFAPYANFILTVEVFFQIALAAGLISHARPSNRIDIAYLFYLPFCMVFISSDRLHRRCAPHFLRPNQEFIWGPDLKNDLTGINAHFDGLSEDAKAEGLFAFARTPPTEGDFLVARLWDKYLRPWRDRALELKAEPEARARLVEELKQLDDATELAPDEIDLDVRDPDVLSISRLVRKRKGSWWQLPKNLKPEEES